MLFTNTQKGFLILIIDLQSSLVRASLVYFKDGAKPSIIYTSNKNIVHGQTSDSIVLHAALESLKEIMGGVYHFVKMTSHDKEFPKRIKEVHFVLSSPWTISKTKTIVHQFSQPTEITRKTIFDIIAGERDSVIQKDSTQNEGFDIIEEKIFGVHLNGYTVNEWRGKKTTSIEISSAFSVASTSTDTLLRNSCTLVPANKIFFHSSLLLQYIALRRISPNLSAYTLLHIHGESTDIVVIKASSCVFFGSYPLGVQGIVRQVARASKTDTQVADSVLTLNSQNSFDVSRPQRYIETVDEAARSWGAELKHMFALTTPPVALPQKTILSAHSHEEFFLKAIKLSCPNLDPELLTFEQVKPFVEYTANNEPVILSGLYAAALHSMMQNDVIQSY